MKYFVVAALMAASSSVNAYLARPVADDFLWISEQSGLSKVGVKGERMPFDATTLQIGETLNGQAAAKDLRIVSITNTNGYKSPGIFLRHNWDLMQALITTLTRMPGLMLPQPATKKDQWPMFMEPALFN